MDQNGTWHGGPGHVALDGDAAPYKKMGTAPSNVYCGQMAGWIKTPLSTEVDLGTGHIVLDGDPAARERGTAAPSFRWPWTPISATAELLFKWLSQKNNRL